MAAAPTLLTSGSSAANPATTASVSPTGNRLLTLDIWVAKSGAPVPAEIDMTPSGVATTWTLVASQDYRARRRLWRYRALESSYTAETMELTYSGSGTFQEVSWVLVEWAGVDTTGTNGSGAVGTPVTGSTSTGVNSLQLTIGDTPAAGDAVSAAFGTEEGGGTATLEAGYTELSAVESGAPNIRQAVAGWDDAADDTTPSVSWSSTSTGAGGIANLVIAGAAGTPQVTATIGLTAAVAGTTAADHAATAAVPLTAAVTATTAAGHEATAAVPLAVAVAPVTDAPSTVAEVTTAIPLALATAGTAAATHRATATVPLAVVVQPVAAVAHQAAAAMSLAMTITGATAPTSNAGASAATVTAAVASAPTAAAAVDSAATVAESATSTSSVSEGG